MPGCPPTNAPPTRLRTSRCAASERPQGTSRRSAASAPGSWVGGPLSVATTATPSIQPLAVTRPPGGGACEQHHAEEGRDGRVEPRGRPSYTPAAMNDRALERDLDRQIAAAHRRFVKAMDERLDTMRFDTKERYFGVLSALVGK